MSAHRARGCLAVKYAPNPDNGLVCDLDEGHLGPHWDPEYGEHFTGAVSDPQ